MSEELEHWKPVVGYEGNYEVSNLGRVRSLDRIITRRDNGASYLLKGQIRATNTRKDDGYSSLGLCKDGRQRSHVVHTLVLTAFVGPKPEGLEGCHKDGDPGNNTPANLRWGTRSSNVLDAVRHGRNKNSAKTKCKFEHRLVTANLVPSCLQKGGRSCWSCAKARSYCRSRPGTDIKTESDRFYAELMREESVAPMAADEGRELEDED